MTSKEIIALEASNTGCINLYKEGLFWRAYERSAYALCTRVHPFKAMKRQLKVLGGEPLVVAGFPTSSEERYLQGLSLSEKTENRITITLDTLIDLADFGKWKDGLPCKQADATTTGHTREPPETVISMLRSFDVAGSTPLDCMMLVSRLQQMIRQSEEDGTV